MACLRRLRPVPVGARRFSGYSPGLGLTDRGSLVFQDREIHPLWLRERSALRSLVHGPSQQRTFEVTDDLALRVVRAAVANDGHMFIEFSDGLVDNTLTVDTLNAGAPVSRTRIAQAVPVPALWHNLSVEDISHDYEAVRDSRGQGQLRFLRQLLADGVAVVRGVPAEGDAGLALLGQIGTIRDTHWGKFFHVVAKPAAGVLADAAYSDIYVPLHTDGPYFEAPLQHQVLHCFVQSKAGGETFLSDGLAAAAALRERDPEAEAVLRRTMVRYSYDGAETKRPHLAATFDGPCHVFFSNRVDGVLLGGFAELDAYYRARAALVKEMYREEFTLRFRMRAGDLLLFDNRRVLHGRQAFTAGADSEPGEREDGADEVAQPGVPEEFGRVGRYLRGCYLDAVLDAYRSRTLMEGVCG